MLYATVRNRKVSIKKPTTIPAGCINVDTLCIDFDEEWEGLTKRCVFTISYLNEVTEEVPKEGSETGETETVTKTEIKRDSYEQLLEEDRVLVPWEALGHVGQLSVSIIGVADGEKKMTTADADSFWEVVESGEQSGETPTEATQNLLDQALAAVGKAQTAAADAENTAKTLQSKADRGAFNGTPGRTPQIGIGTVETIGENENAAVTISGTSTNVLLNFKLPRGKPGLNKPIKGEDYWTDADKAEIVASTLAALPNGDEVAY